MKISQIISTLILMIGLTSCHTNKLEDYFVKASEDPDFLVVNIPSNVIEFDEAKLDKQTLKQIHSIKKFNVLLYRNKIDLDKKKAEYKKLQNILKSDYSDLVKVRRKGYNFDFSYQGKPESIDKLIFFGKDKDYNFMLGLLKADDVNPNNLYKAFRHIKSVDKSQAGSIFEMFKTEK